MSFKTRLFEFSVCGVIVTLCVGGGIYSCVIDEYTNGTSLFIAAPTIVMALWYLRRNARTLEEIRDIMRQVPTPTDDPEARPLTDEVTLEEQRVQQANPFHAPHSP